jgi:hypothetical protein
MLVASSYFWCEHPPTSLSVPQGATGIDVPSHLVGGAAFPDLPQSRILAAVAPRSKRVGTEALDMQLDPAAIVRLLCPEDNVTDTSSGTAVDALAQVGERRGPRPCRSLIARFDSAVMHGVAAQMLCFG